MQRGNPYRVYFEKTVEMTNDWREVKIFGFSTEDIEARFQISTHTPGTFYVDDAVLNNRPGTPAPAPSTAPIPASFFGMHANYYAFSQVRSEGFERPFRAVDSSKSRPRHFISNIIAKFRVAFNDLRRHVRLDGFHIRRHEQSRAVRALLVNVVDDLPPIITRNFCQRGRSS